MFGSSRCQILNIINLWRAVSVIYLLYNSSINIGVAANKNMFNNNVQTLSVMISLPNARDGGTWLGQTTAVDIVLFLLTPGV